MSSFSLFREQSWETEYHSVPSDSDESVPLLPSSPPPPVSQHMKEVHLAFLSAWQSAHTLIDDPEYRVGLRGWVQGVCITYSQNRNVLIHYSLNTKVTALPPLPPSLVMLGRNKCLAPEIWDTYRGEGVGVYMLFLERLFLYRVPCFYGIFE